MLLAREECAESSGDLEKISHPFLCAWLPGTAIYAAAALGYVYVVDGMRNLILNMWPAAAFEMGEDDNPAGVSIPAHQRGTIYGKTAWSYGQDAHMAGH